MNYQELKIKLDKLFAAYIRRRDEDQPCISCGKYFRLEAGHYYSRTNLTLRFDEMNVHGQCEECNRYRNGNHAAFGRGIAIRYGGSVIEALDTKSQSRVRIPSFILLEKIEYYQDKLKNFNNNNGKVPEIRG